MQSSRGYLSARFPHFASIALAIVRSYSGCETPSQSQQLRRKWAHRGLRYAAPPRRVCPVDFRFRFVIPNFRISHLADYWRTRRELIARDFADFVQVGTSSVVTVAIPTSYRRNAGFPCSAAGLPTVACQCCQIKLHAQRSGRGMCSQAAPARSPDYRLFRRIRAIPKEHLTTQVKLRVTDLSCFVGCYGKL